MGIIKPKREVTTAKEEEKKEESLVSQLANRKSG